MQKTWADFAKDPSKGPGWDKVGTKGGEVLGHFNTNGQLIKESADHLDRSCEMWEKAGKIY